MFSNDIIDKETCDIPKPTNVKPARFYLLPKIHKKNNPERPVISSVNCHTTKLSKYVDHFIQPLSKKVKSYIRDTTDLINKIKQIKRIPHNAILVTMDVRSLYSNIKHIDGISVLKECLNNRVSKHECRMQKNYVCMALMKALSRNTKKQNISPVGCVGP